MKSKLFVLAGNLNQFKRFKWDHREAIYLENARQLRGQNNYALAKIGTFWERQDIQEIEAIHNHHKNTKPDVKDFEQYDLEVIMQVWSSLRNDCQEAKSRKQAIGIISKKTGVSKERIMDILGEKEHDKEN